jgi:hypothetical protein
LAGGAGSKTEGNFKGERHRPYQGIALAGRHLPNQAGKERQRSIAAISPAGGRCVSAQPDCRDRLTAIDLIYTIIKTARLRQRLCTVFQLCGGLMIVFIVSYFLSDFCKIAKIVLASIE